MKLLSETSHPWGYGGCEGGVWSRGQPVGAPARTGCCIHRGPGLWWIVWGQSRPKLWTVTVIALPLASHSWSLELTPCVPRSFTAVTSGSGFCWAQTQLAGHCCSEMSLPPTRTPPAHLPGPRYHFFGSNMGSLPKKRKKKSSLLFSS